MMDRNKDESERCVRIAKEALAHGDTRRALKFLRIARRLDNNILLEDLLAACEERNGANSTSHGEEILAEKRQAGAALSKSSESSNGDQNYTEEHIKLVREITRNKDYYSILGLEKSCSVEEIKRAYKKLSLKVHPDKNKAPGSDEAFKTVSKAFKCLSDEDSRRQYDQTGLLGDFEFNQQYNNMRRRRRRTTRNDMFEENFDPDEIFRSFFFGTQDNFFQAPAHHVRRARGMANRQRGENVHIREHGLPNLLHLLPILLFFLFAFLLYSEPKYSLQKTYQYQVPKVTEKHAVEYYVKSVDFDQHYPQGSSSRQNMEYDVVKD